MSGTEKIACVICGTINEFECYEGGACGKCGQAYDYDERIFPALTYKSLKDIFEKKETNIIDVIAAVNSVNAFFAGECSGIIGVIHSDKVDASGIGKDTFSGDECAPFDHCVVNSITDTAYFYLGNCQYIVVDCS